MTISPILVPSEIETGVDSGEAFEYSRFKQCRANLIDEIACTETAERWQKLNKIDLVYRTILELIEASDLADAQKLLERIQTECEECSAC